MLSGCCCCSGPVTRLPFPLPHLVPACLSLQPLQRMDEMQASIDKGAEVRRSTRVYQACMACCTLPLRAAQLDAVATAASAHLIV
jgi:hypothetical protein